MTLADNETRNELISSQLTTERILKEIKSVLSKARFLCNEKKKYAYEHQIHYEIEKNRCVMFFSAK